MPPLVTVPALEGALVARGAREAQRALETSDATTTSLETVTTGLAVPRATVAQMDMARSPRQHVQVEPPLPVAAPTELHEAVPARETVTIPPRVVVRPRSRRPGGAPPVLVIGRDGPSGATVTVPSQRRPTVPLVVGPTPLQITIPKPPPVQLRGAAAPTERALRTPNTAPRVPAPHVLTRAVYQFGDSGPTACRQTRPGPRAYQKPGESSACKNTHWKNTPFPGSNTLMTNTPCLHGQGDTDAYYPTPKLHAAPFASYRQAGEDDVRSFSVSLFTSSTIL